MKKLAVVIALLNVLAMPVKAKETYNQYYPGIKQLQRQCIYENGTATGVCKWWYSSGQLLGISPIKTINNSLPNLSFFIVLIL